MLTIGALIAFTLLPQQMPGLPTGLPPASPTAKVTAKGPCASPRQAVLTWLGNLQPDQYDAKKAATCAIAPPNLSAGEVQLRLIRLKRVLDARGIYVRVDNLSTNPEYVDPSTQTPTATVASALPQVQLVHADRGWMLSAATLLKVPALYDATFPLDITGIVAKLPSWTKRPFLGVTTWQIGFLGMLLLVGWVVRAVVAGFIVSQLRRVMTRFSFTWGEDILRTSSTPLGTLALAGILALGIPSLQFGLKPAAMLVLVNRLIAALSVVTLLYRVVDLFAGYFQHKAELTDTKLDDQLVPMVKRGLKIVIVCVGVVFVLQNLDVDVGSLIAGLGIGGLAFALAAKDTVSHLFGSITIFLDKPFQIGDWVVAAGVEGVVEEVGFRSTRVRTFYNSVVTIPNGQFTNAIVDNYGLRQYRRCSTKLKVAFDTDPNRLEAFCDGIRGIIKAHPDTRKDYYEVHFSGFSEYGLDVMLYFFFEVASWTDELRARHEIFLDLMRLATELEVRLVEPVSRVHVDSHATQEPVHHAVASQEKELAAVVEKFGPGGEHQIAPGQRVHPGYYAAAAIPSGSARGNGNG